MAGHDINYLAQSGILSMLPGTPDKPTFPLNLLADFGGGGLMCAMGILLALIARNANGRGQVVQSDMVSGTRYLSSFPLIHTLLPHSTAFGVGESRGGQLLDGGAPFYQVYTCKDGKWMSIGCIEPQFYTAFLEIFLQALPDEFMKARDGWQPNPSTQGEVEEWSRVKDFLEAGFKTKGRDEWATLFHGSDACAVPVLSPKEAAAAASSAIPVPHPTLSVTRSKALDDTERFVALAPGQHTGEIIQELGIGDQLQHLLNKRIVGTPTFPKPRL